MASSSHHSRTTALCIFSLPLLLITFSQTALPQALSPSSSSSSSSSSGPSAGSCQPQLLSLVPCAPFVQGMIQSPTGSCCNNLNQIYRQQPSCICLLLRNSNFNSLPINGTLALQLPQLCHLQGDASDCSGVPAAPTLPSEKAPNSTATQVSFGARNESSIASSPQTQVAPRPSIGSSNNKGNKLSATAGIIVTALLTAGPYI